LPPCWVQVEKDLWPAAVKIVTRIYHRPGRPRFQFGHRFQYSVNTLQAARRYHGDMASTGISSHILLMGPPGSGKSTVGRQAAADEDLVVVDVGDMLRDEVVSGSPVGQQVDAYMQKGDLAPSDVVAKVLDHRLAQPDVQDHGFMMDGYARRMDDALHLVDWTRAANVHDLAVVGLNVPTSEVLKRVAGRRICEHGHDVNIDLNPPTVADRCDEDGTLLHKRKDDDPTVVAHRMDVYQQETKPSIDFLKSQGLYQEIDGTGTPEQVKDRLMAALARMAQHAPALAAAAH
jgi:adenylate kinase